MDYFEQQGSFAGGVALWTAVFVCWSTTLVPVEMSQKQFNGFNEIMCRESWCPEDESLCLW